VAVDQPEMDLADSDAIRELVRQIRPSLLVNAAAYTAVDKAESEPEVANAVNAESVAELARYAAEKNIPLIHYSTDYVYDGSGERSWHEDDKTAPLNAYGRSKLAGDEAIIKSGAKYIILRTSWVYDGTARNFFKAILNKSLEQESLDVVADQFGAPTYAGHLAMITREIINKSLVLPEFPSGVYHLCNSGETSWHGFATEIVSEAKRRGLPVKADKINPIPASSWKAPAARPANSRLNMDKLKQVFGLNMPDWRDGVKAAFDEMEASK
jgi:dTDP-4-dehydrorhamnose reductase